jgi:Uma2 family endonuclease
MAIRQPGQRVEELDDDWSEYHGMPMTEEAFLALDDAFENDLEYYDGCAWEKGLVNREHGIIAGEFTFHFVLLSRSHGGEGGPERRIRLPDGKAQKPDAAYWRPGIPSGNYSIPTVVVEVRSPDETMASQRRKCRRYREGGVPICWLIDPISRSVEVFEGESDAEPLPLGGTLQSPLLPGFELPVAELWAALDR